MRYFIFGILMTTCGVWGFPHERERTAIFDISQTVDDSPGPCNTTKKCLNTQPSVESTKMDAFNTAKLHVGMQLTRNTAANSKPVHTQIRRRKSSSYHPMFQYIFKSHEQDDSMEALSSVLNGNGRESSTGTGNLLKSEVICQVVCKRCRYRISVRVASLCKSDCSRHWRPGATGTGSGSYFACLITWKEEESYKRKWLI